jgi:hypothetical protein
VFGCGKNRRGACSREYILAQLRDMKLRSEALKGITRHLTIIFCALYLSGAHWALMQAGAWTGMIIARSQNSSFVSAVKSTFSGEKPCSMCKAVAKGHADESKPTAPAAQKMPEAKMIAMIVSELPPPALSGVMEWQQFLEHGTVRTDAPPNPPPLA